MYINIILEVKTVVQIVIGSQIKEIALTVTTQVKLVKTKKITLSMSSTPTSTSDNFDHDVELITQSPLKDNDAIKPTPIELEIDPRKSKMTISSENTPELPNVTPTRTVRSS